MESAVKDLLIDIRERLEFLRELGVTDLSCKVPSAVMPPATHAKPVNNFVPAPPSLVAPAVTEEVPKIAIEPAPKPGSRLSSLPSLSQRRSITAKKAGTQTPPVPVTPAPPAILPPASGEVESIERIRADIGACVRCPLHEGRTQIVQSTGNMNADLMFVGEAPGADEDEQGLPFVGRAGQLLTDIIEKGLQIPRSEVFIGNINRCRPPGNRQPLPLETEQCRPFLLREVAVVKPKVIVVLGNTATQNLLSIKTPISKIRGEFQDYFGVKVMPTFHPAYLLRDPHKKREVWEDMKKVKAFLVASA